jgi:hypothetical protein
MDTTQILMKDVLKEQFQIVGNMNKFLLKMFVRNMSIPFHSSVKIIVREWNPLLDVSPTFLKWISMEIIQLFVTNAMRKPIINQDKYVVPMELIII